MSPPPLTRTPPSPSPPAATGVGVGTALLAGIYLATPKDARDRLNRTVWRSADK